MFNHILCGGLIFWGIVILVVAEYTQNALAALTAAIIGALVCIVVSTRI